MNKAIIGIVAILIIGASIFLAWNFGYIPIGMKPIKPSGDACDVTLDIEEEQYSDIIEGIDDTDIEYNLYTTTDTPTEVYDNYKIVLTRDGYEEHPEYERTITYLIYEANIYAFVKGLTAVVFATAVINECTYVLYSTGCIIEYLDLLEQVDLV